MAARTKSKVTPKWKTKYRVKNWPVYAASLRRRGEVTVWFDEEAVEAWDAPPSGRPGGQRHYSDLAIVAARQICEMEPSPALLGTWLLPRVIEG